MIPGKPAEGTVQSRRIVTAHLDAAIPEIFPEPPRGDAKTTHPIINKPHTNAGPGFGNQGIGKPAAGIVIPDDVVLEIDMMAGRSDSVEPGGIIFRGILEQPNLISPYQGSAGGTGKGLFRQDAQVGGKNLTGTVGDPSGRKHCPFLVSTIAGQGQMSGQPTGIRQSTNFQKYNKDSSICR
ncbi:MAG: hypothetical protein BWY71_01936 [Planctomycetes bacterium ADurb.Bin412]|nr:MAG: hypothetical protein BWY71_01936 [Planctomycetes bacterium ADurb.Bin412]